MVWTPISCPPISGCDCVRRRSPARASAPWCWAVEHPRCADGAAFHLFCRTRHKCRRTIKRHPATCDCHHVGFLTNIIAFPGTGLRVPLTFVGHQIPPAASGLLKNPTEITSFKLITASSPHCSFLLGGYIEISIFCLSLQRFEIFALPSLSVMDLLGAELRGGPVQKYSTLTLACGFPSKASNTSSCRS
jgi:hypothetical protein